MGRESQPILLEQPKRRLERRPLSWAGDLQIPEQGQTLSRDSFMKGKKHGHIEFEDPSGNRFSGIFQNNPQAWSGNPVFFPEDRASKGFGKKDGLGEELEFRNPRLFLGLKTRRWNKEGKTPRKTGFRGRDQGWKTRERGGKLQKPRAVSVMKESGRPEIGKEWESSSGLTEQSTLENSGTGNVTAGGNRCFPKDMFMSATSRWGFAWSWRFYLRKRIE
ncbi:MAG: hypothetical protein Ct9H90mP9_4650 [Pseudomonadota bacterium]|nr:MAG: hypothetical protein Ct9H90mP9_4650 [Pseudomonadota bacterium]